MNERSRPAGRPPALVRCPATERLQDIAGRLETVASTIAAAVLEGDNAALPLVDTEVQLALLRLLDRVAHDLALWTTGAVEMAEQVGQ